MPSLRSPRASHCFSEGIEGRVQSASPATLRARFGVRVLDRFMSG